MTRAQMETPVRCPHCRESRADALDREGHTSRWFCNTCGRLFVWPSVPWSRDTKEIA